MPRSREKTVMQDELITYKAKMISDNVIIPVRAWDAAVELSCPKIYIQLNENEDDGKYFHKFGCVMGECNDCPKWNDLIMDIEKKCTDPIRYCVFGAYYKCIIHGQTHMQCNKGNTHYCSACDPASQSSIQKKYIRMMKSEPMNEFIKEGGTYHTYIQSMLYHTFLVVMLGLTVLAKSVDNEVRSNDCSILFCRDHSERYTPCQTGEIMSEGIGTDGDVSMEGATLLYKPTGSDGYRKILYTHLSDDKKQNGSTVRCNTEYVLNDLDEKGKLPRELLEAIYEIVDGCASQYRCGQVLYFLSQIAVYWRVRFVCCVQAPGHGKKEVDGYSLVRVC
jgi:hypothetical protein